MRIRRANLFLFPVRSHLRINMNHDPIVVRIEPVLFCHWKTLDLLQIAAIAGPHLSRNFQSLLGWYWLKTRARQWNRRGRRWWLVSLLGRRRFHGFLLKNRLSCLLALFSLMVTTREKKNGNQHHRDFLHCGKDFVNHSDTLKPASTTSAAAASRPGGRAPAASGNRTGCGRGR